MKRFAPSSRRLAGSAALLAALAGACSSVGARVHNLDELHTDDGYHRREVVLMDAFEWNLREGLGGLFQGGALSLESKDPSVIDDPLEECLANLCELDDTHDDGRYELALKVEEFARLAVECPWLLSRERCALALGGLGLRLDLGRDPPPPLTGEPVGAEELGAALTVLLTAARPALENQRAGFDEGALTAACTRLDALAYDLGGARRALSFVALIARRLPKDDARFAKLRELERDLARVTVQRALVAALSDHSPFDRSGTDPGWDKARVRAAALSSLLRIHAPVALAEFLAKLGPRTEPELLLAILRAVAARGLPTEVPGIAPDEYARWRELWIEGLLGLAGGYPDGRVRVAAMRALSVVSGGELASLREEDWLSWDMARRAAVQAPPEPELPDSGRAGAP